MEFPLVLKDLVPGIPLDFGYVPRCGVFFHLPSEARETFYPTELGSK